MRNPKYRWMFYQNRPFILMRNRAYFLTENRVIVGMYHLLSARFNPVAGTVPSWDEYLPAEETATQTEIKRINVMLNS